MHYRTALDTVHFSIRCDFDNVDTILSKIKNSLFFTPVPEKSKNPYYFYGWQVPELGFNCFFDPKPRVLNYPISLELNGKFFRNERYAEKFINFIFECFKPSLLFQRVDACVDLIYDSKEDLENNAVVFEYFPLGFPKPIIRDDFNYKVGSLEGHFDFVNGKPLIDLISSGRGEKKLRVYDKDKDIAAKDKVFSYSQLYGLPAFRVFRAEFAVRSDSIKALVDKYFHNINSYSDLMFYVLAGMFKRYDFVNIDFNHVFDSDVSFYASRDDSNIECQLADCLNKLRCQSERYVYLNEKKYKQKCQELESDNIFSRSNYLKQIDFYDAYEILNKEGIY